jgi:hypothetical protein
MIGFRAGLSNTPVVNFMNTFLVANGSNIPGDVLLYGKFRSTSAPINTNAQLGIGKAPTGL